MTPGSAITADTYDTPPAVCAAPTARVSVPTVSTPFWNPTTRVSGPMSGGSIASAPSVSYSFTAKNDDVDRADRGRIAFRLDARQVEIALRAVDAKAARAHRLEVRAAREKRDVGAGRRQPSAKVAADAARTDNRDAHANFDCKRRSGSTIGSSQSESNLTI